mmetsp:Transcript_171093/g.548296  ORF Transcript_171093/g.548296 Transcript_171093/m.548296 type:complete len:400 (+) Transcript_171093:82-1281(+)
MHSEALLGGEKDARGLRHKFWKDHKSDWLAMLLGPAVSVPFAACYAALVCQSPTMNPYFPIVLQQIMWTQLAGGVLSLFLGQFVTTTNMDPLVAILFGQMAHRCELLFRTEPQKLFPHMNVLMPLATCLLGAALYAVGRFRLAGMLRFFPYTVIAGFLAGSGLLILSESLNLSAGTDVWTLTVRTFVSGEGLELSAAWAQLLLGCLYAAVAGVSRDLHTFGTPMLLVACVSTSVAVKFGSSGTFPPPDWFLSYPEPVEWWAPFAAYKEGVEVFEPSKVFFSRAHRLLRHHHDGFLEHQHLGDQEAGAAAARHQAVRRAGGDPELGRDELAARRTGLSCLHAVVQDPNDDEGSEGRGSLALVQSRHAVLDFFGFAPCDYPNCSTLSFRWHCYPSGERPHH